MNKLIRFLATLFLGVAYGAGGALAEDTGLITEPVYFALYGAVFGCIATLVMIWEPPC